MKIVSIKQVLHWLFLIVGIISIMTLAVTVNSYLSYAQEGYGLEVGDLSANMIVDDGYWLRLRFNITNPGKLDMELEDAVLILAGGTYNITTATPAIPQNIHPISDLPKQETTPVVLWFSISEQDHNQIASTGIVEVQLRMEVFVPERYASTNLVFDGIAEVVP